MTDVISSYCSWKYESTMPTEHNHVQLTCYQCAHIMPLFYTNFLIKYVGQFTQWCYVIVAAAVRKDLGKLFSDPQASARYRLCRISSHGSYLKFCVVLVNLSNQPNFWVILSACELLSLHSIMKERRDAQDSLSLMLFRYMLACVFTYLRILLFEVYSIK